MVQEAETPRSVAHGVLNGFVGGIMANVVLASADRHLGKQNLTTDTCKAEELVDAVLAHSKLFVPNEAARSRLGQALKQALATTKMPVVRAPRKTATDPTAATTTKVAPATALAAATMEPATPDEVSAKHEIRGDADIIEARRSCKAICIDLGFSVLDYVKVCTVVSELARNIQLYAGSGTVVVSALPGPRRGIEIVATDRGPGIRDVEQVLRGNHKSTTGMGRGLAGSKTIMDEFDLSTRPGGGTRVRARKYVDHGR